MKRTITLLALGAAFAVGCGSDSNDAPTGATGESGAEATEADVTQSFTDWRYRRASRVGDNETSVSIEDVNCDIESPGEATCTERLVIDSLYLGKQVQNLVWDVQYDEATGELMYAESL